MKTTVYILSFVIAFLIVQPLLPVSFKQAEDCCSEQSCEKKENKKENGNKDCNPLMNCPFCALFIVSKTYPVEIADFHFREKILIKNDNRIMKNVTDCWHPPNFQA